MSKKTQKKKPREEGIIAKFSKSEIITNLENTTDGRIKIYSQNRELIMQDIVSQVSYKRNSGKPKIVNQAKLDEFPSLLQWHPHFFLNNYHAIFAIDTNTKDIGNKKISVACYSWLENKGKNENGGITCNCVILGYYCYENLEPGTAEKVSLVKLIKNIQNDTFYNAEYKIAIVTDHGLENIEKINKRDLPIIDNEYLPLNFDILYASVDVGKEYLLNKLIADCDREANNLFEKILSGEVILNFPTHN